MNSISKFVVTCTVCFIGCKSADLSIKDFKEEKIIITQGHNMNERNGVITFDSNNERLVCLGFLDKFNDTIIGYLNNKQFTKFYRSDSLTYKKLSHAEVFKFIEQKNTKNKVTILLKNEKKKICFNLVNQKKLYLISHYENSWYLTIWD